MKGGILYKQNGLIYAKIYRKLQRKRCFLLFFLTCGHHEMQELHLVAKSFVQLWEREKSLSLKLLIITSNLETNNLEHW